MEPFPTVLWPDAALGPAEPNPATGGTTQVGHAFACRIPDLETEAERLGTTLDGLLSRHITAAFHQKRPQTPVGVWLAAFNDMYLVVVTTKAHTFTLDGLYDLPGRFEAARDFVPQHARPYVLWDGKNVYRVYDEPEAYQPGQRMIVDFGSLFGATVSVAGADTVQMLTASPSFDYSVVPDMPMSMVEHDGSLYVLLHAFWDR